MNLIYDLTDKTLTVKLCGEIDHHGAKTAREEIDNAIKKAIPENLVMDMSSISFCDSSGLGLIMGRYKTMKEYGGELYIKSPTESAKKMITLCGLDKLVKITE